MALKSCKSTKGDVIKGMQEGRPNEGRITKKKILKSIAIVNLVHPINFDWKSLTWTLTISCAVASANVDILK